AGLLFCLHASNYKRVRDRLSKLVQNALATHLAHVHSELMISAQPNSGFRSCTATQSSSQTSSWWGAWKCFDSLRRPSLRPGQAHDARDGCQVLRTPGRVLGHSERCE